VCVIALARGSQVLQTFRGTAEGRLLDEPRGTEGFGYDPLFYYEPFGCTFGEVSAGRKLAVSHRGQALRAMLEYLRNIQEP
jgi:XTP/dITP diphosphohydrolase